MSTAADHLAVVQLVTDTVTADILGELFAATALTPCTWFDCATSQAVVSFYCVDPDSAAGVALQVAACLDEWQALLPSAVHGPTRQELAREDWAEAWKRFFKTRQVSRRIIVKPSWEPWPATPDACVIELDPGMSFGTGLHGTTQACLQFIDDACGAGPPRSFLDVGTGSGILSIAAAKLGCRPVLAIDCDPQALTAARANLQSNHLAAQIELAATPLEMLPANRQFELIAANLLASVLTENAAALTALAATDKPCQLFISGILAEQYAAVLDCFREAGWREQRQVTIDEWTSGCLSRAGDA